MGDPPLAAVLAAPPYTRVPPQSGQTVAHEAVARAGSGVLFIVGPTSIPVSTLEHLRRLHANNNSNELGRFATFLGALPARFRPVTSRTFAGLGPVTVYVYRG